jgi:hypothetical protein
MKTVKILIATAILSTSFYACKKEEMNIQPGEVTLKSSNQSNISPEGTFDASSGMIKIVFNKVGTMIIEGNPNLEKLINMYDASKTAIASANEVFEVTQQEILSITFDRNGNTIASNIPSVPVGSNIDTFINDFCHLTPVSDLKLSITKNSLERNYLEYWDAMPAGSIENFEASIRGLQDKMPQDYTLQIQIAPGQPVNVIILDPNGNPQNQINTTSDCSTGSSGSTLNAIGVWLICASTNWF